MRKKWILYRPKEIKDLQFLICKIKEESSYSIGQTLYAIYDVCVFRVPPHCERDGSGKWSESRSGEPLSKALKFCTRWLGISDPSHADHEPGTLPRAGERTGRLVPGGGTREEAHSLRPPRHRHPLPAPAEAQPADAAAGRHVVRLGQPVKAFHLTIKQKKM